MSKQLDRNCCVLSLGITRLEKTACIVKIGHSYKSTARNNGEQASQVHSERKEDNTNSSKREGGNVNGIGNRLVAAWGRRGSGANGARCPGSPGGSQGLAGRDLRRIGAYIRKVMSNLAQEISEYILPTGLTSNG